jgi:hypothetical protein
MASDRASLAGPDLAGTGLAAPDRRATRSAAKSWKAVTSAPRHAQNPVAMREQRRELGSANYSRDDASVGTEPGLYPVEQQADSPAPVCTHRVEISIINRRNATSPCFAGSIAIVAASGGLQSYEHFMGISPDVMRRPDRPPCVSVRSDP